MLAVTGFALRYPESWWVQQLSALGMTESVRSLLHRVFAVALIATAIGLMAAIPAVIAYNRYADKVVRLEYRYDGFKEEFSSILQRHARRSAKGG